MRKVDLFQADTSERTDEPHIRLTRSDDGTGIEVNAASLLAQYRFNNGDVLLVLDEDSPYEEQLHLVLVRRVAIVDHVLIGAPYAAGIFHEQEVRPDGLLFRFEGEAMWKVGLDDRGSRVPGRLPAGARRRGGWLSRHYLTLSRDDPA